MAHRGKIPYESKFWCNGLLFTVRVARDVRVQQVLHGRKKNRWEKEELFQKMAQKDVVI